MQLAFTSSCKWLQCQSHLVPSGHAPPPPRFGLECALLSAIASALRTDLTTLLTPPKAAPAGGSAASSGSSGSVAVNGLLAWRPGAQSVAEAVAAGQRLVGQGYRAIKVKVARG